MNSRIFKQSVLALLLALSVTSCSDRFGDDLRSLGGRVEILESKVLQANKEIESLWTIVKAIQSKGYISNIVNNADGTYTLTITYEENGEVKTRTYTLHNGTNGQEAKMIVSVKQDTDGIWYWWVNGKWLKDTNGNKVRAGGIDGKDGQNGTTDGIIPQLRINDDGYWEVFDGVKWQPTGQAANGKDGKDGDPDIFQSIEVKQDENKVVIVLSTGQTFTIPLISYE